MNLRRFDQRFLCFGFFALAVTLTDLALAEEKSAESRETKTESVERTLRAQLKPGPNGKQVVIDSVERMKVDNALFVDIAGLRLWSESVETRNRLRMQTTSPAGSLQVINRVATKLLEVGVEPTIIPVRGEAGKKMGTRGMVLLEGGEFTRPGEFWDSSGGGLSKDQKPSRGARYRVRVSTFHIDKYKVTNEDYCNFLNDGNTGYWTPWNPRITRAIQGKRAGKFVPADNSLLRNPVVLINWYQARGYATWAGKRLPTEAEWEYAAGGKEGRRYPWGNEAPDKTRADIPIQYHHTVPVDWFPAGATPEGLFQMAGNSAEWCADYFDQVSYTKAPSGGVVVDPTGAKQAFQPDTWYKYRVMFKGWCKSNRAEYFTCTKRHSRPPLADASAGVSFRCVKKASGRD
ncbi:MAG: formylglycine-generating enzyme family protein [Pirellulaceae bacterium]